MIYWTGEIFRFNFVQCWRRVWRWFEVGVGEHDSFPSSSVPKFFWVNIDQICKKSPKIFEII